MTKQLFTLKEIQAERQKILDWREQAKKALSATLQDYPPLIWAKLWDEASNFGASYLEQLDACFEVAQEWMMKQREVGELPRAAQPASTEKNIAVLVSRLSDPEKYTDAVDDAISVLQAQAEELQVLRAQASGKRTHEVSVRCSRCLADVTVAVSCEYSEIANAVNAELGRGVFGFSLVSNKPYCENCAKKQEEAKTWH